MDTARTRLHTHPQVTRFEEVTIRHPWGFTCAQCRKDFYLRGARLQDDGTLRCRGCGPTSRPAKDEIGWCPSCQRVLPESRFAYHAALVDQWVSQRECTDCDPPRSPWGRTCDRCGEAIPNRSRSDVRYCSTRCRVAAHRDTSQAAGARVAHDSTKADPQ